MNVFYTHNNFWMKNTVQKHVTDSFKPLSNLENQSVKYAFVNVVLSLESRPIFQDVFEVIRNLFESLFHVSISKCYRSG